MSDTMESGGSEAVREGRKPLSTEGSGTDGPIKDE